MRPSGVGVADQRCELQQRRPHHGADERCPLARSHISGNDSLCNGGGANFNSTSSANDLAIVVFPDHTASTTLAIDTASPPAKTAVTMVGYGRTADQDANAPYNIAKNVGTNVLPTFPDGTVGFPGVDFIIGALAPTGATSADSRPDEGDSGGPLLVDGAIIGVASAAGSGAFPGIDGTVGVANYVDLSSDASKAFLAKASTIGARITYSNGVALPSTPAAPATPPVASTPAVISPPAATPPDAFVAVPSTPAAEQPAVGATPALQSVTSAGPLCP